MNYKNIYYKIIEKAKTENENGKRSLGYFEKHHIQPKSLGGTNEKENLVKLTAREHFICHWLLVKMYEKGTIERNKMLCALWRMQGINENHKRYINSRVYEKLRIEFSTAISKLTSISQSGKRNSQFGTKWYTNRNTGESKKFKEKHRYINSRAYEALRMEFAKTISKITSKNQQGNKNSQFGTKWYTNRNTGESKKFKEKPLEDFWIEGRNLFHGESNKIVYGVKKHKKHKKHKTTFTITRYNESLKLSRELWDKYHSGNYYKLEDFANELHVLKNAIYVRFKKYIPIFKSNTKRRHFSSNKNLIGKYE